MARPSPYSAIPVILFLIALPAFSGCGEGVMEAEVEGAVTWRDHPLSGISVVFIPENGETETSPRSLAVTDEEGHYVLYCVNGKRGANAGRYKVLLVDGIVDPGRAMKGKRGDAPLPAPKKGKAKPANPDFPGYQYATPQATPLRQEVATGKQTIDFHLPQGAP
jgi:hypothetical protein